LGVVGITIAPMATVAGRGRFYPTSTVLSVAVPWDVIFVAGLTRAFELWHAASVMARRSVFVRYGIKQ